MKVLTPNFEQIIRSIQGLPQTEQERLRQWLDDKRPSNGANGAGQSNKARRMDQSLRWLDNNRLKYLGLWVALDGDRLIASGQTAKDVYSKSKAEGVKIPFIDLVQEEENTPFSGGWLS